MNINEDKINILDVIINEADIYAKNGSKVKFSLPLYKFHELKVKDIEIDNLLNILKNTGLIIFDEKILVTIRQKFIEINREQDELYAKLVEAEKRKKEILSKQERDNIIKRVREKYSWVLDNHDELIVDIPDLTKLKAFRIKIDKGQEKVKYIFDRKNGSGVLKISGFEDINFTGKINASTIQFFFEKRNLTEYFNYKQYNELAKDRWLSGKELNSANFADHIKEINKRIYKKTKTFNCLISKQDKKKSKELNHYKWELILDKSINL